MWTDTLYQIPAGEITAFSTNWKTWYGDLSDGKYRIIKKIYETIEDEIHTHYLAVEFEIDNCPSTMSNIIIASLVKEYHRRYFQSSSDGIFSVENTV
ncbi:MAG: immunoglobulin-like domain-containing protein [Ruminococcus callidus]